MTILPNKDGHQPSRFTTPLGRKENDDRNLEKASDKPKLEVLKSELQDMESDASTYNSRHQNAQDWLSCRWEGQTKDGLKWHTAGAPIGATIWPWEGASDTRTHIITKIVGEHETVASFALRNMKIQAVSSRPVASMNESRQATQLLNWMIGTHMQAEAHRETRLALNWRNAFGSSVIAVDWIQERRIEYVQVSLMTLPAFAAEKGMTDLASMPLTQWISVIGDESNEDALIPFVQKFSPIVTKAQARKILKDLRELRFAEVPVPYVLTSQPRWRAMRPMVDVFFPVDEYELNLRPRYIAEPEWVTETELTDRIETANYDPGFVRAALEHKGNTSSGPYTARTRMDGTPYADADFDNKVQLWRFKYRALDRGTPVLFETIFHQDIEMEAIHGPCQYQHGQFGYHSMRFEHLDRPLLSSRGIAEIGYTWQNEIKKQRDGRTDRVDLTLRPPMFAHYQDVLKMKADFQPGIIVPERRDSSTRFMPPPQYDPGSIEIEKTTMAAISEHFGLFGLTVDPILKQQRMQQFADDVLIELKPVINQTWQLMQQLLPDNDVAAVTGALARPFHVSRQEIQGQYNISATVDMRNIDQEFIETKISAIERIVALDSTGSTDRNKLTKLAMETVDRDLAEAVMLDSEPASKKEIMDERNAVSLIIGSGLDQPLPEGANFQLRLQTLQSMTQEIAQNPAATKNLQSNPETMQVLQNRAQYFQRQLQQVENKKIGKAQVSQTFTKQAPMTALPLGA